MPLAEGTRIGPYEVLGLLGAGGMGEVWRARDTRLSREVAIKVLPSELAGDPARRSRLEREARAVSALNHPNIVTVYELGQEGDLVYVAFEKVEGRSLREEVAGGPLSTARLLDVALQTAEGLAKAHAEGVVHRDLKPDNVMVTREGVVKILDFGLARLDVTPEAVLTGAPTDFLITEPGALLGTLGYMSPEQASGQRVDHRSDQFSLGSMLYELACGRRAFARATPRETLAAVLQETPEPVSRRRTDLPARFEGILQRCLAKDPDGRYASTRDLASDLRDLRTESLGARAPAAASGSRWGGSSWRWGLGGLAGLAALGSLFAANPYGIRDHLRSPAADRIDSVAVLPLANLSKDPEQEFFADGMTEALITELAKVGSLRVISRTSVMQFKGTTRALPEIARQLGVDAVVEGSVQRAGGQVRITAQLIRAATDHHLWADSYERDLRDVLALQSDVARAIAREVAATLTPAEAKQLVRTTPVDPVAYEIYLRGLQRRFRGTEADIRGALSLFEQALGVDPSFALAHQRVCEARYVLGFTGWGAIAPREAMPKARASCLEALKLDPSLVAAQATLGAIRFYHDWDVETAEAAFALATHASLSDPGVLQRRAWFLANRGRHSQGLVLSQRALELDPLSLTAATQHGWLLFWARRYDPAIAQLRRVLEERPSFPLPTLMLAIVHSQRGEHELAVQQLERAVDLAGGTSATVAQLAHVYGVAGRRDQAQRLLADLIARSKREYVASYWIALAHHGLGQEDQALARLEIALDEREAMPLLEVEPRWDSLRPDPRFQALLRRTWEAARTAG